MSTIQSGKAGIGPARRRALIRVMVVDDSITVRSAVCRTIDPEPDIVTVATAGSAEVALEILEGQPVDVIVLDLEMPGMGGLAALPKLLETAPEAQVLVVSSLTARGAEATVQALAMGAADTLEKPRSGQFDDAYRSRFLAQLRALGEQAPLAPEAPPVPRAKPAKAARVEALALGASTGGIHALSTLLRAMPATVGVPIFVTQHLPSSFMTVFAGQLASASGREAVIAQDGMAVQPGRIHIAPGDGNIVVAGSRDAPVIHLTHERSASHCLPSLDPMFASLAGVYGEALLAVVLTGMGRDGLAGARDVAATGGTVLAQSAESCAVYGMPRGVVEAGLVRQSLPPAELGHAIGKLCGVPAWT